MRDIIVIGSGAGGAVVAKELAARGLDVLVLEAGMHHKNSEQDFTHFEIDQSSPVNGVLRFGPSDRTRQSWARELPQHSVITQIAGVGGTTLHYLGNSPRAMPGAFKGYSRGDWAAYDRSIDVLVSRVRQKLGDVARKPAFIRTVRGTGYTFVGAAGD